MARHRRQLSDRIARRGLLQLGAGVTARQQTGALTEATPDAQHPRERTLDASGAPDRGGEPLQGTTGGSGRSESVLEPVFAAMPEREFQAHVEEALKTRGYLFWHVRDPRLMRAGLPDIIAVHPTKVPRRVLFFELKTATGRVSRKQREALAALGDVYGVWTAVVRPSDWPAVLEDL